jgi:dipeptidyl aminopeptidase/acylaminoacyl peptidase
MRTRLPRIVLAALVVAFLAGVASAALPPLIDRELIFGDPEISGAQISPDGKFIAFIKPLDGTRNIWVKGADEPFEKARPITADTKRPIPAYFWSKDGKFVLFVQDQGGDENYNVFAVNPAGAPAEGAKVPAARNVTDAKGARAMIYRVSKKDPDLMFIGLNDRDAAWHDVYRLKISTGERTLVRKNLDRIAGWTFDEGDGLRLATRTTDKGDTEILRVDGDALKTVYTCGVADTCAPVRFHKDGKRVYLVTNKDTDLIRLVLFDPASGEETLVDTDPEKRVDLESPIFSEVSEELVGTAYVDDRTRVYWRDKDFEKDFNFLRRKLGDAEIGLGASTTDERKWIVSASSDVEPGAVYLFDRDKNKLTLQYQAREKLPRLALAPMKPIRYPSSDGLEIPAYLTLPKGVPAKGLPLVLFPHGGPWARDTWGYDAYAQFLANRGYAVLQTNFRSSTGYGKKFLNAGNNEWGQKMQDDLTWGVKYLVAEGIADPKRVGIMGGSYGGYAALAGVTFTPDLYAAAVPIVAPSNLITLLDSIPPYWEAIRTIFYTRMGDPRTPEGKAQLLRQSPLTSADKIKTPLLIVQGANDPRVKRTEADQIVIALRDRGFPVEYLVAPDEGHGFARPVNNMAMLASAEKFLAKHLGGRFQESATPEVAARLKEITVDPKTVVLAKPVDASAVSAPRPSGPIATGTWTYVVSLDVGGQSMKLSTTTEIKQEGADIVAVDRVKSPMGEAVDSVVLDPATLTLRSRSITQGPISVKLDLKDGKASGELKMGDQPQPISADLGGALFADGAGAFQSVAALPLADGYQATFRNFDLQSQKVKVRKLAVTAAESVTVAAGTFDCFKVEMTTVDDAEKATAWISKDGRKVVKVATVSPQMNGAVITSELQP